MIKKFLVLNCFLLLCSCWGGLAKKPVIKHPDSSMQLLEFRNSWFSVPQVKIAVYSKSTNTMLIKGWIDTDSLKEWTATKYDWNKKILERQK